MPVINDTIAGDTKITGTGIKGATVTVTRGEDVLGEATVKDDGTWEVTVPEDETLAEGDVIKAIQEENGKQTSDEATKTVAKAQQESAKPTITAPKAGDTSVSGTGVKGATVVLKDKGGNKIGEATVDQDGNWKVENIPADKLVEGEKVTAEQTEPGKKPSSADATIGAKAQQDKKTSVDEKGKKPVKPTDDKQDKSSKNLPKTGDTANLSIFAGIMGMTGSLLALIGFKKRKKEDEQE